MLSWHGVRDYMDRDDPDGAHSACLVCFVRCAASGLTDKAGGINHRIRHCWLAAAPDSPPPPSLAEADSKYDKCLIYVCVCGMTQGATVGTKTGGLCQFWPSVRDVEPTTSRHFVPGGISLGKQIFVEDHPQEVLVIRIWRTSADLPRPDIHRRRPDIEPRLLAVSC